MLFSKSKPKSDELLPPPPPFPSMGIEERPKHAEIKTKKSVGFDDLFKEVKNLEKNKTLKQIKAKLPKAKPKKELKTKKLALLTKKLKKILKQPKKIPKIRRDFSFEDHGIDEIGISKSGEIKVEHDGEIPETMDFGTENDKFSGMTAKPGEILEAESEIKSAIEKIREKDKPSFLKRLFGQHNGKQKEVYEKDDVSGVESRLTKARQALMNFDLDAARISYLEIMRIYKQMAPKDQAKVYNEIKDLYYERKSAEQLKVKS